MVKRGILAVALAIAVALTPAPVQAQPNPIPPGETLFVTAYYSSSAKTTLVGQRWVGCGISGSWGVTSPYINYFFTPC